MALLKDRFCRMKWISAAGGYAGPLTEWTPKLRRRIPEIVRRGGDVAGRMVLPKRWIVERTYGWFGRSWGQALK